MANTVTELVDTILAMGIKTLRENCVTPMLVRRDMDDVAAQKGDTITITGITDGTAKDMAAAATHASIQNVDSSSVSLSLNYWRGADFALSDKEIAEIQAGSTPRILASRVKAIANDIDTKVLNLYKDVYYNSGTPGTAPFASSLADGTNALKELKDNLCPTYDTQNMFGVINTAAEANALKLQAFADASYRGEDGTVKTGMLGSALGVNWYMNQNVPTHTTTAAGTCLIDGGNTAGDTTIHVDGLTTTAAQGDTFTIDGDTTIYTVVSATALAGTDADLTITPALAADAANDAAVTFADYSANMIFHRDAFVLAMRRPAPERNASALGYIEETIVDPITGIPLRLTIQRQHNQTMYQLDTLFGVVCVQPECAVRFFG